MQDWVIGVCFAIVSSIVTNLGTTVQKYSHMVNAKLPAEKQLPTVKQWIWWSGFSLFAFSQVLNMVSLAYAPESLIAPLASISILMNVATSFFFLREKCTWRDVSATLVIVTGGSLCIIFGPHPEDENILLDELLQFFAAPIFIIYLSIILTITALLLFNNWRIRRRLAASPILTPSHSLLHGPRFFSLSYPLLAGIFTSLSLLMSKSLAEVLRQSLEHDSQLSKFSAQLIILGTIVAAFLSLYYINAGLQVFDARYMIPFYFTVYVILTIVEGIVYFQEWTSMSSFQSVAFTLSVLFTCGGIGLLTSDQQHMHSEPAPDTKASDSTLLKIEGALEDLEVPLLRLSYASTDCGGNSLASSPNLPLDDSPSFVDSPDLVHVVDFEGDAVVA